VLIHGAAAHRGWWSRVAPILAERQPVVLLDLTGHGGSDDRAWYDGDVWAAEVAAVVRQTCDGPAVLVGHSMGGLVAITAAARTPELVAGLVLVDTRLPLQRPLGLPPLSAPVRSFRTPEEALARFRLLPAETSADPGLLDAVARTGLVETSEGWRWRYDRRARHRFTNDQVSRALAEVVAPTGYVYGAESAMGGPGSAAWIEEVQGRRIERRSVPGAHHHVPLDRPVACADEVESVVNSLPVRG
jgi:pimeloyl-ACP methyl ester carboxylesterase